MGYEDVDQRFLDPTFCNVTKFPAFSRDVLSDVIVWFSFKRREPYKILKLNVPYMFNLKNYKPKHTLKFSCSVVDE